MCLALYLFTNSELTQNKWDETNPQLFVETVSNGYDRNALKWPHNEHNVYYLGGYQGCGCGWAAVEEWDDDFDKEAKQKDRISLANLLRTIEQESSWLVACWEGDQGSELSSPKTISVNEISNPSFELTELQQYRFTP